MLSCWMLSCWMLSCWMLACWMLAYGMPDAKLQEVLSAEKAVHPL